MKLQASKFFTTGVFHLNALEGRPGFFTPQAKRFHDRMNWKKAVVGWAALQYVQPAPPWALAGSTAAHFIDALGTMKGQIEGAACFPRTPSTENLQRPGIRCFDSTKCIASASMRRRGATQNNAASGRDAIVRGAH